MAASKIRIFDFVAQILQSPNVIENGILINAVCVTTMILIISIQALII